jgi:hypothetical protein
VEGEWELVVEGQEDYLLVVYAQGDSLLGVGRVFHLYYYEVLGRQVVGYTGVGGFLAHWRLVGWDLYLGVLVFAVH